MSISTLQGFDVILKAWICLFMIPPAQAEDYVRAGNVHTVWEVNGVSANAHLTNLTFIFHIENSTLQEEGTFFAHQFYFSDLDSKTQLGYLGLQPQKNRGGKSYLRAVFSSFISGTSTSDKNCRLGADGGEGVSCGIGFPADYGHVYSITIHKSGMHSWSGDLEDTNTGEMIHIGSWSLPESTGDLKSHGEGFAEYYAFYRPGYPQFVVPDCSRLAYINVLFGPVSSTDFGGVVGDVSNSYEYDTKTCTKTQSGFFAYSKKVPITLSNGKKFSANGQVIIRGFVKSIDARVLPAGDAAQSIR